MNTCTVRDAGWMRWNWTAAGAEAAPPLTAHEQMALDEVLLARLAQGERRPLLRFWRWTQAALVLGSHQSVRNEVDLGEARRRGIVLARRMSGGGAMLAEPARTITYSLYAPAELVDGMSFVRSFAFLDGWLVEALRELGVPAEHRPVNDIASPEGKIGGAAQARRRAGGGVLLHHTTMAYSMDVESLPRLIRIGRRRRSRLGVRSAEKKVSPLDRFLQLSCCRVEQFLLRSFIERRRAEVVGLADDEVREARELAVAKYATPEWIWRLP